MVEDTVTTEGTDELSDETEDSPSPVSYTHLRAHETAVGCEFESHRPCRGNYE